MKIVRSQFASAEADEGGPTPGARRPDFRGNAGVVGDVARVLSDRAGSADFRGRLLAALGPLDDARIAQVVLTTYPEMEPGLKPKAIELLTQRPAWSRALIAAVEARTVPASAVNVNQLRRLQASKQRDIAEKVKAIWGSVRQGRNEQRELVVGQMRTSCTRRRATRPPARPSSRSSAASATRSTARGRTSGPTSPSTAETTSTSSSRTSSTPASSSASGYQATTVATTDGRVLTGLLAEDSTERVVLKIQGGKVETIPRSDVEEMKTSPLSLMPEDVETQLTAAGNRRPVRLPGPRQAAGRPEREAAPRIAGVERVEVKSYSHTPLYPAAASP